MRASDTQIETRLCLVTRCWYRVLFCQKLKPRRKMKGYNTDNIQLCECNIAFLTLPVGLACHDNSKENDITTWYFRDLPAFHTFHCKQITGISLHSKHPGSILRFNALNPKKTSRFKPQFKQESRQLEILSCESSCRAQNTEILVNFHIIWEVFQEFYNLFYPIN